MAAIVFFFNPIVFHLLEGNGCLSRHFATWTFRYTSQNWTSHYIYISLQTSNYTYIIVIDPLERYHSKYLVELNWMIVKLMGLDNSGQSYDPLRLVEFNSGLTFKSFYFGPESRYINKFSINRHMSELRQIIYQVFVI
jgi:hypothetical protein